MLETLVIQTCVFLQEEDWGSIVPSNIAATLRKQGKQSTVMLDWGKFFSK